MGGTAEEKKLDLFRDRFAQEDQRHGKAGWRRYVLDFLRGAASTVDPMPLSVGPVPGIRVSNGDALASDWRAVGHDMRRAILITRPSPPPDTGASDASTAQGGSATGHKSGRRASRRGKADAF